MKATHQRLKAASEKLARSESGRAALAMLLNFLEVREIHWDVPAREAFVLLLRGSWGVNLEVTKQVIRDALEQS